MTPKTKLHLSPYELPEEKHLLRQKLHLEAGKAFKASWDDFDNSILDNLTIKVNLPKPVPIATDPRWANLQFGAADTVKNSACIALTSKLLLDYFDVNIPFKQFITEVEEKGYVLWKLKNSKITLNVPKELQAIKSCYCASDPIQSFESLELIYQLYGEPEALGGSMFLIDNLIYSLSNNIINLYQDTRIKSIYKLINILGKGFPVPIRINNSIYHNNTIRTGGHFVTLVGFSKGEAIVADTSISIGYRWIPARQLFEAMMADEGLICAWNVSHCKRA